MNRDMNRVLIVEDEKKLSEVLVEYLKKEGYETQVIDNGDAVMEALQAGQPDIILLDLMLPGKDGMTLCREIRACSEVPLLMTTARVEEIDRLLGLELGADDYICKPYSPREVVARVKAVLRRVQTREENTDDSGLELNKERYQARIDGKPLTLTAIEFQLLSILSSEPGRIFSRSQLMDSMYSDNRIVSERTIDSHIKKLRKSFHGACPNQQFIQSVYGVGYRFERNA